MGYLQQLQDRLDLLKFLIEKWNSGNFHLTGNDGDETEKYRNQLNKWKEEIEDDIRKWKSKHS